MKLMSSGSKSRSLSLFKIYFTLSSACKKVRKKSIKISEVRKDIIRVNSVWTYLLSYGRLLVRAEGLKRLEHVLSVLDAARELQLVW